MKHVNLELEKLEQRIAPGGIYLGIGGGVGVGVGGGVGAGVGAGAGAGVNGSGTNHSKSHNS
jgi:hypothetical protein